jgi:hypothetical protein
MRDKRRQDPQEGGHPNQKTEQRETIMRANGDKVRHDPPDSVHPIQQRETKRGTMRDKGRQDLRKRRTDTPSNKGKQEGYNGRQRETKGDKTLMKADTPSNTKGDTLRKH